VAVPRASGEVPAGDAIVLENLQVPAALGVSAAEREMRRPVRLDLEIGRSLAEAGASDRIEETVDYGEIYRVVEAVDFAIDWVRVAVRKAKPLAGVLDSAGVRITRYRSD